MNNPPDHIKIGGTKIFPNQPGSVTFLKPSVKVGTLNGYSEAEIIDMRISKVLASNPITASNAIEWLKFLRTVKTTCEVLYEIAMEKAKT